jgi:hypothetical protein
MAEDSKFIPIQQRKYANVNSRIYQGWKRQQERKKRDFINFYPQDVPKDESDALIRFYKSGNGDNWTDNTGWLTDPVVGNWAGITVKNGHVTEINLRSQNVKNANLDYLKILKLNSIWLYKGSYIGKVDSIISTDIEYFRIGNTGLYGNLEGLRYSDLSSLWAYNVGYDFNFSGNIDIILSSTTNLKDIYVPRNVNILGDISFFATFPNLIRVYIDDTGINSYTSASWSMLDGTSFGLRDLGLSQAEIDNFLVDMDNSGSTNCTIDVLGNSAPSQTGLDAIASLEGKGCTITYDTV